MLQGVKEIVTRLTLGDEYGIYQRTNGGQLFCLFTFDKKDQAVKIGEKLSRLLGRPFVNQFSDDDKKRNGNKHKVFSSVVSRKK